MGRFALMLLLLASSVVVSAQSLQDVRIVTADDPPYVQTENGRLSGGLVVTRLYRVLDKRCRGPGPCTRRALNLAP